ncbi:MAG: C39 family peptidase [Turicibacter sp.]|nr:C39 family peptidase [Turicibacter sp.]MDO5793441.1 C39 family peptidase [Turicibacter sp.]
MKRYLLWGLLPLLAILTFGLYCITPFPTNDKINVNYPDSFTITQENSFETQVVNECSAFSSAYVLRHFGENKTGLALYDEFNYKLPFSGYVLPKGILDYFKDTPYQVKMYTGTFETLKTQLTKGTPIIVLVGDHLNWQHYMTVVGYNDTLQEVYFFDSLRETDENESLPGNRTLSTDYFLSMWDNGLPIFNHLYFVIEKR